MRRKGISMDLTRLPFEEEQLPWYSPEQFYPVHIGEVFKETYKVVGKLGYGSHSTVWLCRDVRDGSFASLKVCTRDSSGSSDRELRFYEHVSSLHSEHPGQSYIRGLFEAFKIKSLTGEHLCLVQPPMHMTIRELQYQNSSHRLNKPILRWTLSNVLNALSFLHDDAAVVHTGGFTFHNFHCPCNLCAADINPSNIMLTIDDNSLLEDFEKNEAVEPSPTKVIDSNRTIYGSRKFGFPKDSLWGRPVLCDFGEARIGPAHRGLIQPELYRAPEVLFDMDWTSSVDIWNVAVLTWDLFENRHLFRALDDNDESSATHHVAEMVAYLGHPPLDYVHRSKVTSNVFDESGAWKDAGGVGVPQISLEEAELFLNGEDKEKFLGFVRSMLTWLPEERKRGAELLKDSWLKEASS